VFHVLVCFGLRRMDDSVTGDTSRGQRLGG
jgi:hypothetical protein